MEEGWRRDGGRMKEEWRDGGMEEAWGDGGGVGWRAQGGRGWRDGNGCAEG